MRVLADIDEADVGELQARAWRPRSTSTRSPARRSQGKVSQVRYSPDSGQGVVTYAAVIEVDNPDVKLRPGMTATVTVTHRARRRTRTRVPERGAALQALAADGQRRQAAAAEPLPSARRRARGASTCVTDETPGRGEGRAARGRRSASPTASTPSCSSRPRRGAKIVTDETDDPDAKKQGPRLF